MDGHRRGAPWSAALSALLVISCLLALGQPANANTEIWALHCPTGMNVALSSSGEASVGNARGNVCDGDLTTAHIAYAPFNAGAVYYQIDVTTPAAMSSATVGIACSYFPVSDSSHLYRLGTSYEVYGGASTNIATATLVATITVASPWCGTSRYTAAITSATAYRYWFVRIAADASQSGCSGYCGQAIGEIELFAAPAPVGIEQYCYDMQVGHPAFGWTGSCRFRQAFEGTITFTASSSAGSFKIGATGNAQYNPSVILTPIGGFGPGSGGLFTAGIDFEQDCYPLCQSATITMSITDTTNSQTASYAFQRSSDGFVQEPTYLPVFISYSGCYNVTLHQCPPFTSAAGTTDITWSWTCNLPPGTVKVMGVDTTPDCASSDASVQIGPLNAATAGFTVTRYSVGTQAAGSYSALGLTTSTTQNRIWVIELVNPAGTTRGSVTLDFVTGGTPDTYTKPKTGGTIGSEGGETCAGYDVGCALRNFFNVSEKLLTDAVSKVVYDLRDLAMKRQPFNWIVRAFDGVSAQLGRAAAAVTTTSTCTGYVMVLPTSPPVHYNTPTATMTVNTWPTSVPAPSFAVLKCADLEPWGGTTWYQNIRAAMDPAIYLGWGLAQLRTLRRGPVAA